MGILRMFPVHFGILDFADLGLKLIASVSVQRALHAPDWLLLLASAGLILAGPAMAWQEWSTENARASAVDETAPLDLSYRAAWRAPLLILVFLAGALALYAAIRVILDATVRALAGRLLGMLLCGAALAFVAFVLDGALMQDDAPWVRMLTIVWLYPIAGVLIGGSAHRLAELREHFGSEP